jgi:hypothetical protein
MNERLGCPMAARPFYLRMEGNNMNEIPDIPFIDENGREVEIKYNYDVPRDNSHEFECVRLTEHFYDSGMHNEYGPDFRKACKVHHSMPLSGKEEKFGQNWHNHLVMCPRCCEAVPVTFKVVSHRIEMHCRKCQKLGHKDGSLIREIDLLKLERIIDG